MIGKSFVMYLNLCFYIFFSTLILDASSYEEQLTTKQEEPKNLGVSQKSVTKSDLIELDQILTQGGENVYHFFIQKTHQGKKDIVKGVLNRYQSLGESMQTWVEEGLMISMTQYNQDLVCGFLDEKFVGGSFNLPSKSCAKTAFDFLIFTQIPLIKMGDKNILKDFLDPFCNKGEKSLIQKEDLESILGFMLYIPPSEGREIFRQILIDLLNSLNSSHWEIIEYNREDRLNRNQFGLSEIIMTTLKALNSCSSKTFL